MWMSLRFTTSKLLCACAMVGISCLVLPKCSQAQTNNWSNPSGGFWDDFRNWSLGVRPASPQAVLITNAPTKLVTLDSFTSSNYPTSLTITSLTLSAASGLTNTLFLSNPGTTTPLTIQDSLAILSGGALLMTNSSLQVGGTNGGSFILEGTAAISGTNSFSGGVYLGLSTNSLGLLFVTDGQTAFTNGYKVIGFYGSAQAVLANGIVQAGDDQSLPNGVFLGLNSGAQGVLSIGGGKFVSPDHLCLGEYAGSTGAVWITGGQLILTNNYLTTIGDAGAGQLVLSNGQLLASSMIVGTGPGSLGALTVAGGTATLSGGLVVGDGLFATGTVFVTGGQLVVTNQNTVIGSYGAGQLMVSNGVVLAQALNVGNSTGSFVTNQPSTWVGLLTIAGGTTAVTSNIVAGVFSNANGIIQISGGNLTVTNQSATGSLVVGQFGNAFLVQNGGLVNVDSLAMGAGMTSNAVVCCTNIIVSNVGVGQTTISNGVLLTRNLLVAVSSQGSFTLAGGTASVSSNITIGLTSNAVGVLQVTGGNLFVTNQNGSAQLIIGQQGQGNFTQNGGASTVDQLVVTNGTNNVVNFSSGVFNTKSTTVSNSHTFVVGDSLGAATYHLLGGIHSFANTLRIRNNATLSGCGTINGNVLVDLGGTVLADCGGTLTFTGTVTNNGSWKAINGTVLESSGPVVNNGLINVIDGHTSFLGGFINNGVVLTADNLPRILSVSRIGPDIRLNFTTVSTLTHIVEFTTNLVSQSWTPLFTFTASGTVTSLTDSGATALPQRFYRVHLVVPP
jgi:T5SS/PEP-CTERM-associated repeat protein